MKIGICGIGFVGNAVYKCLLNYNHLTLFTYDKYKKINDFNHVLDTDILFICLPTTINNEKQTYDMREIDSTIKSLSLNNYKGAVLIKSTILPPYCANINNIYTNLKIIHNPEFLTARTAVEDFENQKHIVLGFTKYSADLKDLIKYFYKDIFPFAEISITSSECSSLMKLSCNSFYAVKIQFLTEIYLLCNRLDISYNEVKTLMLNNKWINPEHTTIPGPDGHISFGGACFPKDITALSNFMDKMDISNNVISFTIEERNRMRDCL